MRIEAMAGGFWCQSTSGWDLQDHSSCARNANCASCWDCRRSWRAGSGGSRRAASRPRRRRVAVACPAAARRPRPPSPRTHSTCRNCVLVRSAAASQMRPASHTRQTARVLGCGPNGAVWLGCRLCTVSAGKLEGCGSVLPVAHGRMLEQEQQPFMRVTAPCTTPTNRTATCMQGCGRRARRTPRASPAAMTRASATSWRGTTRLAALRRGPPLRQLRVEARRSRAPPKPRRRGPPAGRLAAAAAARHRHPCGSGRSCGSAWRPRVRVRVPSRHGRSLAVLAEVALSSEFRSTDGR